MRGGLLTEHAGDERWQATMTAPIDRVALTDLDGLWTRTRGVGAYDAPYVALAARDTTPLLTSDARLARGARDSCRVTVVTPR